MEEKEAKDIQGAAAMLEMLHKKKSENVMLFFQDWKYRFSAVRVPPIRMFPSPEKPQVVLVNRIRAIEYLKSRYNFYSREERDQILNEIAKDIQNGN